MIRSIVVLALLLAVLPVAFAAPRICVVPIKDSKPSAADAYKMDTLNRGLLLIPGLPGPVFNQALRGGVWAIDDTLRFVPFDGPFPKRENFRSGYVVESWSGRVVATADNIYILQPPAQKFAPLTVSVEQRSNGFSKPYLLPRRRNTIVANDAGVPLIVAKDGLTPWMTLHDLHAAGVEGIRSVHDAPQMEGAIVLDREGQLHFLGDESRWQSIASISKDDYVIRVSESARGQATILQTNDEVFELRRSGDGAGSISVESWPAGDRPTGAYIHSSALFGDILTFDYPGILSIEPVWRRLTVDGLQDIPVVDGPIRATSIKQGRFKDLTSIGRSVITTEDGLYLYDGHALSLVPGSGRTQMGYGAHIYDLPTIGRAIMSTETGLYDLKAVGPPVKMETPFEAAGGFPFDTPIDWPQSGIALIATKTGIWMFDDKLNASPVEGGNAVTDWYDVALGIVPSTGDVLLSTRHGFFLAVDAGRDRRGACNTPR